MFFWFDDWLQMGKLIDITGPVGPCHLGVARNAKVIEAVRHSAWNIRGQRSRYFHDLHERIRTESVLQDTNGRDIVLWRHDANNSASLLN